MRIHICLVSSDPGANELVRRERIALIPKTLRDHVRMKDIGAEFAMSVYDPTTAGRSLPQYILEDKASQFFVLMVDRSVQNLVEKIASGCFVADVEFNTHPKTNYKNYLAGILSRLLKNLAAFHSVISDGANEQVMLLPFRSFNAQQLRDLRDVCRTESLLPEFYNSVVSLVEALKGRRRPHRRSGFPENHIVDDDEKMFRYGHEKHAQIATGTPHTHICALLGYFRFGWRIAPNRHFNVMKELGRGTQIEGSFFDCHDDLYVVQPTSHLNIFSNDYRA